MTHQEYLERKFSIYAAHWVYSVEYHTGQWSRAYALSCNLTRKGYRPGLSVQHGDLTDNPQAQEELNRLIELNY